MNTVKEWGIALDEAIPNLQEYENNLSDFYESIGQKKNYLSSMMCGCYKKYTPQVFKAMFSSFFKKLLGSLAIGLTYYIIKIVNSIPKYDDIKDNMIHNLPVAGIITGISLLVLMTIWGIIHILSLNSKISKLDKLEEQLKPVLKTVPSNYRNTDKINAITKVIFTRPDIDPEIILECADSIEAKLESNSKFSAVMFDLPCNCQFLDITETPKVTSESSEELKKNEFLPSDIETKVYAGSEDSDKDLTNMIGLDSVKDQIKHLKNRMTFYGKNATNNGNHMAFLGSAGTGKTSVARIVTKILFDLGYIKNNQYIEISGDYLCAGNTSRAMAIIEYSYGGVLFIDEAYLMYRAGSEIIGVLLKAMEDHREDFIVILAGYEEQMTKLFASNEGFSSRIKHNIYFPDYTEEEMLNIFNYFIKNYNDKSYRLDTDASDLLLEAFKLEKKAKSFGNARTVRNAVDMIMDFYADRSIAEKSDTRIIMYSDVENYYNNRKKVLQHEIKNTSAVNQVDESIIRLSELKTKVMEGSIDPESDLNELIGLESFKNEIDILKNQKEFYGKTTHQKVLFIGEHGCGKSSLVKILTGFLYKLGYIQENKYLDISAELLKGSFVGHTAKRAEAIISYAAGGVLYIENYNTLGDDNFAAEAINAIHSALEKNENVTIVIADEDSTNIRSIENMFTLVYEFPTYTNDQLLRIFDSIARKDNFIVEESARQRLLNYISNNKVKIRDIQQIYSNSVKNHINNYDGNEQNKYFISNSDLVLPESNRIRIKIKT